MISVLAAALPALSGIAEKYPAIKDRFPKLFAALPDVIALVHLVQNLGAEHHDSLPEAVVALGQIESAL